MSGSTSTRSTARVRGDPVRQARTAGSRARKRRALRRRAADDHLAERRATSRRLGRRGELLRGRHRPPASGRGRPLSRPLSATGSADGGRRAAQGVAARLRRPHRRVGDRAGAGGRRAPPGGRLHHRPVAGRAGARSCALSSRRSSRGRRWHIRAARRPKCLATTSCCTTSRPASPRTTSSRACGAACRARPRSGTPGRLTRSRPGLLLVLVGRATRAQRFLMALPKSYEVVARFGAVSSTGDSEGEIVATGVVPDGDLDLPTGRHHAAPAGVSRRSRSAGGVPTRSPATGVEVELAEREVEVYRFDELWRDGDRRAYAIECSSGTYVRSLIADLGDAYCEQLRRTRIGEPRRRRCRPRAADRAGAGAGFPARDRARRRAGDGGRPRARDRGRRRLAGGAHGPSHSRRRARGAGRRSGPGASQLRPVVGLR